MPQWIITRPGQDITRGSGHGPMGPSTAVRDTQATPRGWALRTASMLHGQMRAACGRAVGCAGRRRACDFPRGSTKSVKIIFRQGLGLSAYLGLRENDSRAPTRPYTEPQTACSPAPCTPTLMTCVVSVSETRIVGNRRVSVPGPTHWHSSRSNLGYHMPSTFVFSAPRSLLENLNTQM